MDHAKCASTDKYDVHGVLRAARGSATTVAPAPHSASCALPRYCRSSCASCLGLPRGRCGREKNTCSPGSVEKAEATRRLYGSEAPLTPPPPLLTLPPLAPPLLRRLLLHGARSIARSGERDAR